MIAYFLVASAVLLASAQSYTIKPTNRAADPFKCPGVAGGCMVFPVNCSIESDCTQLVSWSKSPDDKKSVRFKFVTATFDSEDHPIDYIAFGVGHSIEYFMNNASVVVCGFNNSAGQVTSYLSHNTNKTSTILPAPEARAGVNVISAIKVGPTIVCVVDVAIEPTPGQVGLKFPLDHPWMPAIAVGPSNPRTGLIQFPHYILAYETFVTVTNY